MNKKLLSRDDYKAVKHMDMVQMEDYLKRVFMRGYVYRVNEEKNGAPATTPESEAAE